MILGQRRIEIPLQIAIAPVADVVGHMARGHRLGDGLLAGGAPHEGGRTQYWLLSNSERKRATKASRAEAPGASRAGASGSAMG